MSTCILVIGLPRSGTSLVAGLLHRLGISMGQRFQLANDANPTGFWSDLDLETELGRALHGRENRFAEILHERNEQARWGYKTGAGGLAVPLMEATIGSPIIIATRRPREQSRASVARLGFAIDYDQHYAGIIAATQPYIDGEANLVIDYKSLVESPETTVRQLARFVDMPLTDAAMSLVEPALWRAR